METFVCDCTRAQDPERNGGREGRNITVIVRLHYIGIDMLAGDCRYVQGEVGKKKKKRKEKVKWERKKRRDYEVGRKKIV